MISAFLTPACFDRSARALAELDADGSAHLQYRAGPLPVLVTSVHGFSHLRDGVLKPADAGTREFSHLLAQSTQSSWLAVARPDLSDSNHVRDTDFKQRLRELLAGDSVALVVDIHAAHAFRAFDVDVGTLEQRSWQGRTDWRALLFSVLAEHGFIATDNEVFMGYGTHPSAQTVTGLCAELGVPAVQLEISSAYLTQLDSRLALHQHAKLANALAYFVRQAGLTPHKSTT
jgi:hypothetical protein